MSVLVIQVLELVDVQHDHRQREGFAPGQLQRLTQPLHRKLLLKHPRRAVDRCQLVKRGVADRRRRLAGKHLQQIDVPFAEPRLAHVGDAEDVIRQSEWQHAVFVVDDVGPLFHRAPHQLVRHAAKLVQRGASRIRLGGGRVDHIIVDRLWRVDEAFDRRLADRVAQPRRHESALATQQPADLVQYRLGHLVERLYLMQLGHRFEHAPQPLSRSTDDAQLLDRLQRGVHPQL